MASTDMAGPITANKPKKNEDANNIKSSLVKGDNRRKSVHVSFSAIAAYTEVGKENT